MEIKDRKEYLLHQHNGFYIIYEILTVEESHWTSLIVNELTDRRKLIALAYTVISKPSLDDDGNTFELGISTAVILWAFFFFFSFIPLVAIVSHFSRFAERPQHIPH